MKKPRTISNAGLALICQHEGYSATAYLCPAGKLTIGYGHLIQPGESFPVTGITMPTAMRLLARDCQAAEQAVARHVRVPLTQAEFDALVSFTFNIGAGKFATSTLLRMLNVGNRAGAAGQFGRWVYAKGVQLPGLVTRRAEEAALFRSDPST